MNLLHSQLIKLMEYNYSIYYVIDNHYRNNDNETFTDYGFYLKIYFYNNDN